MTKKTEAVVERIKPLSRDERIALERCEATILLNAPAFLSVGSALLEISRDQLYRETHRTFNEYVEERWPEFGVRRAQQLIAAAKTVSQLGAEYEQHVRSEHQLRSLTSVPDDEKESIFREAMGANNGKPPTTKQVKEAKEAREAAAGAKNSSPPRKPTPAKQLTVQLTAQLTAAQEEEHRLKAGLNKLRPPVDEDLKRLNKIKEHLDIAYNRADGLAERWPDIVEGIKRAIAAVEKAKRGG